MNLEDRLGRKSHFLQRGKYSDLGESSAQKRHLLRLPAICEVWRERQAWRAPSVYRCLSHLVPLGNRKPALRWRVILKRIQYLQDGPETPRCCADEWTEVCKINGSVHHLKLWGNAVPSQNNGDSLKIMFHPILKWWTLWYWAFCAKFDWGVSTLWGVKRHQIYLICMGVSVGEERNNLAIFLCALAQLSNDPFQHTLIPERSCGSAAQKVSFRQTRHLGFTQSCRHQRFLQASHLGPSHDFRKGINFGAISVLGQTTLLCPFSGLHVGVAIMVPPASL